MRAIPVGGFVTFSLVSGFVKQRSRSGPLIVSLKLSPASQDTTRFFQFS